MKNSLPLHFFTHSYKISAFVCFRVDQLTKQYSELEDEFRIALQIEATRFKEVCFEGWLIAGQ